MRDLGSSMLWYWTAYLLVTGIGIAHTIFNIAVLGMKSMKDSPGMGEGYERTKPWHPLYNLLVFPLFAFFYLRGLGNASLPDAVAASVLWGTLTVAFDAVGWVLVKHPWSLTPREFYLDYQPWITLIYLAIYASPFIAYGLIGLV